MSYLQVEIGGRLRGLKFNQFAAVEYAVISAGETNPIFHSYALIYAGLLGNCKVKREELTKTIPNPKKGESSQPDNIEVPATFEDVCDWVDLVKDPNIFIEIRKVYESTLPPKPDVKKKLVVKKKSQPKNTKRNARK